MGRERAWLTPNVVKAAIEAARRQGVSSVAAWRGGFGPAFLEAGGVPASLGNHRSSGQPWRARRNAFVSRHMAQVETRGESLWKDGAPTRRHLALAVWAYSPDRTRLERWLRTEGYLR